MSASDVKIKVFDYLSDLDAFILTEQYRALATELNLIEWSPVVWIGRFFVLDNDYGEHWFDNEQLRARIEIEVEKRGYQIDDIYVINPERFKDGKDGPCHSSEHRKLFWTDVLQSLQLSLETLFDEARIQAKNECDFRKALPDYAKEAGPTYDIEGIILGVKQRYGLSDEH